MDTPELESMNVDEIKSELLSIDENTSKEVLISKIDFLVKQLNLAYDSGRRNNLLLLEALECAQSKYKKYESEHSSSIWQQFKRGLKKVLIAWDWYEASYDELKEIHNGKAGNTLP